MITWVMMLYLQGADPAQHQQRIAISMEYGGMCRQTCKNMIKARAYEGKEVVNCRCERADRYYAIVKEENLLLQGRTRNQQYAVTDPAALTRQYYIENATQPQASTSTHPSYQTTVQYFKD